MRSTKGMRVAGDTEDYIQQPQYQQQPMRMNNQQPYMQQQPMYSQQTPQYEQQPMYSQPQQKDSIGALLALFIMSKGGKIVSTIILAAMFILFWIAPILASILTMGYLILISIINFLTGKIRLGQLVGGIIGIVITFIIIGFAVIVS